jgi:hypothetical protein
MTCTCCAGQTEGSLEDLCTPCFQAITRGTRDDHPHPLSAEQQGLRDESTTSRGLQPDPFWEQVVISSTTMEEVNEKIEKVLDDARAEGYTVTKVQDAYIFSKP